MIANWLESIGQILLPNEILSKNGGIPQFRTELFHIYSVFLQKTAIKNCIAQNVDFTEADLSHACCIGSDFSGTRFENSNLTGADFRGARNYTIPVLKNQIAKARFSLPEALSLLSSLDLEISDLE